MKALHAVALGAIAMVGSQAYADKAQASTTPVYGLAIELRDQGQIVGSVAFNAQEGRRAAVQSGGPSGYRIEAVFVPTSEGERLQLQLWLMRDGSLKRVAEPSLTLIPGRGASFDSSSEDGFSLSVAAAPVR